MNRTDQLDLLAIAGWETVAPDINGSRSQRSGLDLAQPAKSSPKLTALDQGRLVLAPRALGLSAAVLCLVLLISALLEMSQR